MKSLYNHALAADCKKPRPLKSGVGQQHNDVNIPKDNP